MTASLWLVAGLACAEVAPPAQPAPANTAQDAQVQGQAESVPVPRPSKSQITAVTVYQGQALVTREVTVPEGDGTIELVVTPLPADCDSSLYTEGTDGLRVLSTRFRLAGSRKIHERRCEPSRSSSRLFKLMLSGSRKRSPSKGRIFSTSRNSRVLLPWHHRPDEEGRLDSAPILTLSKFVMETRGAKTKTETDLRQRLQANTEAIEFATRQLTELSAGSSRVERDAVIVVHKTRPQAGTVRLGYLVARPTGGRSIGCVAGAAPTMLGAARVPRRLDPADRRVLVKCQRHAFDRPPSLDAAPPELLPLKMAVAGHVNTGPIDGHDDRSQRIVAELAKPLSMSFANETTLDDILKYIKQATASPTYNGIPIYVDPIGLQEAEKSLRSTVTIDVEQVPLRTSLSLLLNQLGLAHQVKDGVLTTTSEGSAIRSWQATSPFRRDGWHLRR